MQASSSGDTQPRAGDGFPAEDESRQRLPSGTLVYEKERREERVPELDGPDPDQHILGAANVPRGSR